MQKMIASGAFGPSFEASSLEDALRMSIEYAKQAVNPPRLWTDAELADAHRELDEAFGKIQIPDETIPYEKG